MNFKNVVLMSDLDGTLLTDNKEILEKDLDAINRFRSLGGMFTIATGRGYSMAKPVAEKLSLDIPAVIFNGAAVYDFNSEKFLWCSEIDTIAKKYMEMLMNEFPDIGIEVLKEKTVYVPAINDIERMHLAYENVEPAMCPIDDIPAGGWLKVLTAYPPEKMDKVVEFVNNNCLDGVHWVRSEAHFFEMLPCGVNKGSGFKKLLELLNCTDKYIVAAGDYMNDFEMVKMADLGVAVCSAQEQLRNAAKLIVCDNNSGAICEIIDYIETL